MKASPHLSWRRTAKGGIWAFAVFVSLVGGFMAMRALGIGPAGSLFASGRLGPDERLLVAEFGVMGGADSSLGAVVAGELGYDTIPIVEVAPEVMASIPDGSTVDVRSDGSVVTRDG